MTDKIKATELRLLDGIFQMEGGYVLEFSNRTFSEFFEDELNINIDHPRWEAEGTSKAKRLRYFLRHSSNIERTRVLIALWEYREASIRRASKQDPLPNHREDFGKMLIRFGGPDLKLGEKAESKKEEPAFDAGKGDALLQQLMEVGKLEPHPRGFAFEKFLKNLFDANDLLGRASFRVVGEQIDGSFELQGETYLLEAKWTNTQIGSADLRSFNSKVEDKATWSRGIFISDSGFSEVGIESFGRAKSIVCMDGLDLSEMLMRRIPFSDVVRRKVRRCAETGRSFVRVRDLYQ
jgi:hypothetical protein